MIGFYNYTVILTYIGLASAVTGIYFAMEGKYVIVSVIALLVAGLCDMFDGKIARTKKNRTEAEKKFGIQIDSLCDLICFGFLPGAIGWAVGMREIYHYFILVLFTLSAVVRLAYFNVMEEERQKKTKDVRKTYEGLPVTSVALIMPLFYGFRKNIGEEYFADVYAVVMLVVGIAFITRFKVKKPQMKTMLIFVGIGALEFLWLLYRYKFR
ncbi:MAG: CDP-diacylglycerol--serine O-phosphatidyltransferase [Ruminococcus sp.]|nr:CDP-diacylglycerol--serine O-phosphatidyltransferase [Ruminococcus sp.]